jgi:hypothetical protein
MAAGSTERTSGYFGDQTPTKLKSKTTTIVFDRYNVLNVRDPLKFFARLNIYYKSFVE